MDAVPLVVETCGVGQRGREKASRDTDDLYRKLVAHYIRPLDWLT